MQSVPVLDINLDTYIDLCNIESGVLSPLKGFLCSSDYHSVVEQMHLTCGSPWTIPITLDIPEKEESNIIKSDKVDLKFNGAIVAELYPEDVFKVNYNNDIEKVFGTNDTNHPGVQKEVSRSPFRLGGKVSFKEGVEIVRMEHEFTPTQTKAMFQERGWKTVVGFQTRNPIHRAHEYLQRVGLEVVDGIFIQPLLGWKKVGDFSAKAVVNSYLAMVETFYPNNSAMFGVLNTAMRYAGPREAVFHAIIRRNYGCTHFIVGRDHAGVGSYYGKYDAHKLCSQFPDLGIEILKLHGPFYCHKCESVVTEKTCPHDGDDVLEISGTLMRQMISDGEIPPKEYMRKEIASILVDLSKKGEAFNV